MRVLVFTAKFPPVIGGVEVFLGNLLPAMAAAGYEVEVVTSAVEGAPEIEEVDHVLVRRLPLEGALLSRDLRAALMTRRAVADLRDTFRPDVIHVHDPGAATWLHLRTRDVNPRPVVLTVHTTLRHVGSRATKSFGVMLRHADRLVAVSDAVRRELTSLAPERGHDIDVIRPAVPLPAPPSPVPLDPVRLLMVGRLVHQKGFDLGLRAFARVAPSRRHVDLEVAGAGPEESALRRLAIELGIADRVTWHGELRGTALAGAFERATLLLMPSRYEGYPLVALEAAGHGRGVVAARAPGLDEAILDGTTGVLVPIDDVDALANAVETLLAHPSMISDMGRAARQNAGSERSFDRCVAAHEALYHSLVSH